MMMKIVLTLLLTLSWFGRVQSEPFVSGCSNRRSLEVLGGERELQTRHECGQDIGCTVDFHNTVKVENPFLFFSPRFFFNSNDICDQLKGQANVAFAKWEEHCFGTTCSADETDTFDEKCSGPDCSFLGLFGCEWSCTAKCFVEFEC